MQNGKHSIRKIVSYINDSESEGRGFWLPNIQHIFVWSEEQINRLFDFILREHPESTLTADENGVNGKCNVPSGNWYDRCRFKSDEEQEQYLATHLAPHDPELCKLENYEAFKQLIQEKFRFMLRTAQGDHL